MTEQACRVAAAMCGQSEPGPMIEDFYFWSDQHGARLQFAGEVEKDPRLVWINGDPGADRFAVLCCSGAKVTAVFSLGCPRDFLVHSMPLRRGEAAMAPLS